MSRCLVNLKVQSTKVPSVANQIVGHNTQTRLREDPSNEALVRYWAFPDLDYRQMPRPLE